MWRNTVAWLLLVISALSVQLFLIGNRNMLSFINQAADLLLMSILAIVSCITGIILLIGKSDKNRLNY